MRFPVLNYAGNGDVEEIEMVRGWLLNVAIDRITVLPSFAGVGRAVSLEHLEGGLPAVLPH